MTTTQPERAKQPTPDELLGAIRWNTYRLTITTRPGRNDPHIAGATTATAAPLITQLRDAIRPNQGRTDSGRGGGNTALPYDHVASTLLNNIDAEIRGMYRSALEREPIGTTEQLLLEWLREFEYSYRANDVIPAQLTTQLQRIRGWRFQIEDHFTPPRTREFAFCPECGYTDHLVLVDGEIIQQRCILVTWWPGNTRRDPVAECRRTECTGRWTGWDELRRLNEAVEANIAEYGDLEPHIIAPLPTTNPDALAEEQETPA